MKTAVFDRLLRAMLKSRPLHTIISAKFQFQSVKSIAGNFPYHALVKNMRKIDLSSFMEAGPLKYLITAVKGQMKGNRRFQRRTG